MKNQPADSTYRLARWPAALAALALLVACASPLKKARSLAAEGQHEQAVALLAQEQAARPDDADLRVVLAKEREIVMTDLLRQADAARAAGRFEQAQQLVTRMDAVLPRDARVEWMRDEIARSQRLQKLLAEGRQAFERGQYERAEAALRNVAEEDKGNTAARSMLARIADARAEAARNRPLLAAADKSVTLEFRDAPLRSVFEALSRAAGVNFVFDKDVRSDQRVTLFLRDTTVDEAMRVILSTQQLDRKLLNENSVLIYPNNQQKQREHQELVTRNFYLVNADVKQAQTLVRTMAKTRDIYIDERLNLLVVRDAPEVVRLVERLIDSIDIAEPEVMMDVQVMEVSSNVLRELGLTLPTQVGYGLQGSSATSTTVTRDNKSDLRFYIANPAAMAKFGGSDGDSRILANPRIRARNHEKARFQIGNKLPVFTTNITGGTTGTTSTSVNYLDVGLKLEVEPSVLLDDDVIIKVGLEVSNVVAEISANDGKDKAYNIGTRQTATALRLRDGQTQVLAGLINDEDRSTAAGIVGLNEIPILGRLFGTRKDTRDKTEIVLLITPHIVRNVALPPSASADVFAGTDTQPGALALKMTAKAKIAAPSMARGSMAPMAQSTPPTPVPGDGADGASPAEPTLGGPQEVMAGSSFQITVSNPGTEAYAGDLLFDAGLFVSLDAGPNASAVPVRVEPRSSRTLAFTVKPQVADGSAAFTLSSSSATHTVTVRRPGQPGTPPSR